MPAKKTKLALFDIDGTIFRSSLAVELIHELVEQKVFPAKAWTQVESDYRAWLNREGPYEKYLHQLIEIFKKYLPNKKEKVVLTIAKNILKEQRGHVYRYTRNLVHELQKKKYTLVAISGSLDFLVEDFAGSLGFQAYFGTEMEVKNGVFTGKALILGDQDKLGRLKHMIAEKNLSIDWKNSIAVGDTMSDIPLLQAVGKPIAFNPNEQLARVAQKKKWKIVVERKDVVYEIKQFSFNT